MAEDAYLPPTFRRLIVRFPDVYTSFESLSAATHAAGPLSERDRRLVKLGIAIGRVSEGSVRSNARKALDDGLSPEEIRQAAILAITSGGLPTAMAALSWIETVLSAESEQASD